MKNMKITITENAAEKIKNVMAEKRKTKHALRIGLVSSSCDSYVYDIDFEQTKGKDDIELEVSGLRVFIAKKSIAMLNGVVIDYNKEKDGFMIENPNLKKESELPILQ